jgi:hypothetical protein
MSDIVFVLGAGASAEDGAPTMGEFLNVAEDLERHGRVADSAQQFACILQARNALQAVLAKADIDPNNIEDLFALYEMARVLGKMPPQMQNWSIDYVLTSLKRVVTVTLERTLRFPVENGHAHPPSTYHAFVQLLRYLSADATPRNTVSVISFNYDVGLDYALHWYQLGPCYHLDQTDPVNGISLLKLHGSLNWAFDAQSGRVKPVHIAEYESKQRSVPLLFNKADKSTVKSIGSDLPRMQPFGPGVTVEPLIVPPTWNKTDYQGALRSVWARAAQELAEAREVFVVGYSLPETDKFFKYLFGLGAIGTGFLRQFGVFDKARNDIVGDRFRALLGPFASKVFKSHPGIEFSSAIMMLKNMHTTGQ